MSEAAVGSISHILKTAFKDVYETDKKRDLAAKARHDIAEKERIKKEAEEALLAGGQDQVINPPDTHEHHEAVLSPRSKKAAEDAAKKEAKKKPPAKGKGKEKPPAQVPVPVSAPEPPPAEQKDEPPVDPKSLIENYFAPIEILKLDENLKDVLATKTTQIRENLAIRKRDAEDLSGYLSNEKERAKVLEVLEEEALKRRGIMIGQHIPPLPTKLDVDKSAMSGYGEISSNLMVAKDLVTDNYVEMLRRTGNMEISQLTETRLHERQSKSKVTLDAKDPHYIQKTATTNIREEKFSVRFATTIMARQVSREVTLAKGIVKEKPRKRFVKKDTLTPEEREGNEEVLRSMNHKLNYLRNPRNDPKAVTKMLVKPSSAYDGDEKDEGDTAADSNNNNTSSTSKRSKSTKTKSSKSTFGKIAPLSADPMFVANPTTITFNSYEIDQVLTRNILFRNVSAVTRSLRVIPPASTQFSIAPLVYPANCVNGLIAPGMCATTTVTFMPDSRGDFNDAVEVRTEGGSFKVAIHAQREAPVLTIPSTLNVGVCLLADAARAVLNCVNTGGAAKFRVLKPEHFPEVPLDLDWANMGCTRLGYFTVYPVDFTLRRGENVDITVEYVPLSLGNHHEKFLLLSDNGQVREIVIRGSCRMVDVTMVEVNNVEIDDTDKELNRDMFFDGVTIGSDQTHQMCIANDTGMPIEYEWVWLDVDCKDLRQSAVEAIAAREKIDGETEAAAARSSLEVDMAPANRGKSRATPQTAGDLLSLMDGPEATPSGQSKQYTARESSGQVKITTFEDSTSKNLYAALMNTMEGTQTAQNVAVYEDFTLSPARGTLPSEGILSFDVSYSPKNLSTTRAQAVLVLKKIPHAALASSTLRSQYLEQLENSGHGDFHRLRSWVEDIGLPTTIAPYKKLNGDFSTEGKITNVACLWDMVRKYASGNDVSTREKQRVDNWCKNILVHMHGCRYHTLEIDEDERAEAFGRESTVTFNLYDWDGDAAQTGSKPELVLPVLLTRDFEASEDNKTPEQKHEENLIFESCSHLLREAWVDVWAALQIFGPIICRILDSRVKHEAIEYIQESEQATVVCLKSYFTGRSQRQILQVSPPLLRVGGRLSIGSLWSGSVTLHNPTSCIAEAEICVNDIQVNLLTPDPYNIVEITSSLEMRTAVDRDIFRVLSNPQRLLLMPETPTSVDISVLASNIGKYEIIIPVRPYNDFARIDNITIVVEVVGARLLFDSPEVDVGLVGVGMAEDKVLRFTNDSNIPTKFVFKATVDVDTDANIKGKPKGKAAGALGGGQSTQSIGSARDTQDSSRMNSSRSTRSDASGISMGSTDSFAVENATAIVTIDPPAGEIAPQESASVTLRCKAGQYPQRVRGQIECILYDISGRVRFSSQFLSMRGEVQAPKTLLYPMNVDLERVYVGMPVKFEIFLENICNLPTKFKFERPGGDSASYKITFTEAKGTLGSKEKVAVQAELVALTTGAIDDVLACKIFGVQYPLGFTVAMVARGLLLEFALLPANVPIPRPLAKASSTQYPGGGDPPEPLPTVPLEFGDFVKLYERRELRFTIRNFSAIPTPFSMAMKKFEVKDKKMLSMSSSASIIVSDTGEVIVDDGKRRDLIIAPHEDGLNIFHSEAGKKYIGVRLERQEDLKYLSSGLGAAYSIEPATGNIAAWGVQVITVRAFNDMPGCYDDSILCTVMDGGNVEREMEIPVTMTVGGCPLIIKSDSVGVTTVKRGPPDDEIGMKLLKMGDNCVNCPPIIREFKVLNNGSKEGKLKWKVVNIPPKQGVEDGSGRGEQGQDWENGKFFKIDPRAVVIRPYTTQTFTVTLQKTDVMGSIRARLDGSIRFDEETERAMANQAKKSVIEPTADEVPLDAEILRTSSVDSLESEGSHAVAIVDDENHKMAMLVEGLLSFPTIRIDRKLLFADSNPTLAQDGFALKMKTQAPSLYTSGVKPSEVCSKPVVLVNPLDGNLLFSVVTDGPFTIKHTVDDQGGANEQERSVARGKSQTLLSASNPSSNAISRSSIGTSSSIGKMFNLLPNTSASFAVAFTPKKDLRETLSATLPPTSGGGRLAEQEGSLIITFTTGQSLHVPLKAQISTPFISASSPRMMFGVCHVKKFSEGTLLLSNPTDVVARWSVSHVPGAGAGKRVTAIRVKGFEDKGPEEDDPSVFIITPNSGSVEGPTVSVASAVAAPPKCEIRRDDEAVVPQRLMEASWASGTLTLKDSMQKRHDEQNQNAADAIFPLPLIIRFQPKKNVRYSSRFRFTCEFGNSFDILFHGQGTYEEHEHRPLAPAPR